MLGILLLQNRKENFSPDSMGYKVSPFPSTSEIHDFMVEIIQWEAIVSLVSMVPESIVFLRLRCGLRSNLCVDADKP